MQKNIFFYCLFLAFGAYHTTFSQKDSTLFLKEIHIKDIQSEEISFQENLQKDSTFQLISANFSLADRLAMNGTSIFIKNYGSGLSSLSLRGTSASHTQIFWNEIPLQSPMLGQLDLSILPSFFLDELTLNLGNESLKNGAGGFGGALRLDSKLQKEKQNIRLMLNYGSFNSHKIMSDVHFRLKKWVFRHRFFYDAAQNNFPFVWQGEEKRQVNAESQKIGQLAEANFLFSPQNQFSFKIWLQNNQRALPPPMTVANSVDKQSDEVVRILGEWKNANAKRFFRNIISFSNEKLIFENPTSRIFSKSEILSLHQKTISEFSFRKINFEFSLQNAIQQAKSNAYEGQKKRIQQGFFMQMSKNLTEKMVLKSLLRAELLDFEKTLLLPSMSLRFDFLKNLYTESQLGLNGRFPTMNDLYWTPGGNQNLKSEQGAQFQTTFGANVLTSPSANLQLKMTYFDQKVNHWIQWIPAFAGFWQPENLKSVRSRGFETSLTYTYTYGRTRLYAHGQYAYTQSRATESFLASDETLGKQLIYVPLHNVKFNVSVEWKNFGLRADCQAYSERFINADNSSWLVPYFVGDITFWAKHSSPKFEFNYILQCQNFSDAIYQSMAFYPRMGRSWHFTLVLKKIVKN